MLGTWFLSFSQFLVLTLGNHRYWLQEALGVETRVFIFFSTVWCLPQVILDVKARVLSFFPLVLIPFPCNPMCWSLSLYPFSFITLLSIFCHCSLYFLPLSLQLSLSLVSWPVAGIWQIYVDCLSVIILIRKRVNSLSSHFHKQNILYWA